MRKKWEKEGKADDAVMQFNKSIPRYSGDVLVDRRPRGILVVILSWQMIPYLDRPSSLPSSRGTPVPGVSVEAANVLLVVDITATAPSPCASLE